MLENDVGGALKCPFDGHFRDSEQDRASRCHCPEGIQSMAGANRQGIAERMHATAFHTRFLNVEDVFFLSAVVIENAVPTIRVGAEATPPLGSD